MDTDIFHGQCVKAVTAGGIEASSGRRCNSRRIFGGCFFTDPTTSKPTFSNNYPASTNASDIVALFTTIQESSSKSSMMVQAQRR